eukprot:TRINITY_DN21129_c0_g1_i5.p1 TRINITY_DN21129_c0_g1~~TRINITY_DN21129_c0_g1_i5.p1  ORF type:complete len:363 (+),score=65.77 TRINITY_DN21129_c0_g1_i5:402-1490(+)
MEDLMGLLIETVENSIVLVSKPLFLFKDVFLLGVRTAVFVTLAWLRLLKAIICFPVNMCLGIIHWTIALASLPFRILNAFQKEKVLEFHLHEMEIELQNIIGEKKEVYRQLEIAIKDLRFVETILIEIEEEHNKAIVKIELLKNELQVLKDENLRLKHIQGKGLRTIESKEEMGIKLAREGDFGIPLIADSTVPPRKSGLNGSGVILQHLLMDKDAWKDEKKGKSGESAMLKLGSEAAHPHPFPPLIISSNIVGSEVLDQRRDVALSQSLFSTILSLVVGMIIWEAEDPCMPLVIALFTVVGISLKSVVQFFSTIRNKPASEAVALLSFNCFILGTLTSPTVPTVAHMLSPPALRLAYWMVP